MSYRRGDVVLILFPYVDLVNIKKRPALVVQSDTCRNEHSNIIVAKITSKTKRAAQPGRVYVRLSDPLATGTGLLHDSVIATDHLATIDQSLVEKPIGHMSDMTSVDQAIRQTLAV